MLIAWTEYPRSQEGRVVRYARMAVNMVVTTRSLRMSDSDMENLLLLSLTAKLTVRDFEDRFGPLQGSSSRSWKEHRASQYKVSDPLY